jgi:hypothetical protein
MSAIITLSPDASEKEAIALAKQTEVIQRYLENQEIRLLFTFLVGFSTLSRKPLLNNMKKGVRKSNLS